MNTPWEKREAALCAVRAMRWELAAKLWREIGHITDAEACEGIIAATTKGDRFRARVSELMEEAQEKAYRQADEEIYG